MTEAFDPTHDSRKASRRITVTVTLIALFFVISMVAAIFGTFYWTTSYQVNRQESHAAQFKAGKNTCEALRNLAEIEGTTKDPAQMKSAITAIYLSYSFSVGATVYVCANITGNP